MANFTDECGIKLRRIMLLQSRFFAFQRDIFSPIDI